MKAPVTSIHVCALAIVFCLASLTSCTTTRQITEITGSWKAPEAASYRNFFVIVLSKNLPARTELENDIAFKLKKKGVKVTRGLDLIPHTEKVETPEERHAAVEKIQSLGCDAIITVALVKKTEDTRYVPGTSQYTPMNIGSGTGYGQPTPGVTYGGSYDAFGGYYMTGSPLYTQDGYYQTDKTYFVQSNVYDAATKKLVWSAQSETFAPINIEEASESFSNVMVDALNKASLIYHKEKSAK